MLFRHPVVAGNLTKMAGEGLVKPLDRKQVVSGEGANLWFFRYEALADIGPNQTRPEPECEFTTVPL